MKKVTEEKKYIEDAEFVRITDRNFYDKPFGLQVSDMIHYINGKIDDIHQRYSCMSVLSSRIFAEEGVTSQDGSSMPPVIVAEVKFMRLETDSEVKVRKRLTKKKFDSHQKCTPIRRR